MALRNSIQHHQHVVVILFVNPVLLADRVDKHAIGEFLIVGDIAEINIHAPPVHAQKDRVRLQR